MCLQINTFIYLFYKATQMALGRPRGHPLDIYMYFMTKVYFERHTNYYYGECRNVRGQCSANLTYAMHVFLVKSCEATRCFAWSNK